MKTFDQYTKGKELKEFKASDIDLKADNIQFHVSELLGDLLKIMWAIVKFLSRIVYKGAVFSAVGLHRRYNKEARQQRKELAAINKAIKSEKKQRAKAVLLAAYTSANIQAENERKLLKKLTPAQKKEYAAEVKKLDGDLSIIIDKSKKGIKAVKEHF